jgi:hypothetical protein
VHFVTKVSLYFLNLRKILCLMIPMKSILWLKNFGPLYRVWPKSRDQWWSGHWVKNFFFAIFGTFGRYETNLRGTFVENVKKSKINPPYCTCRGYISKSPQKTFLQCTLYSVHTITKKYFELIWRKCID